MQGGQTVEALLEFWRQALVRLGLVGKQRVSAAGWAVEDVQEGSPRRLLLVRHVRVPCHGAGACLKQILTDCLVRSAVDKMDFREALWST